MSSSQHTEKPRHQHPTAKKSLPIPGPLSFPCLTGLSPLLLSLLRRGVALPWDSSAAEDDTCQGGGRSWLYPAHLPAQKCSELGHSSDNKLIPESPCVTQCAAHRQSVLGLHFMAMRSAAGLLSKPLFSGSQLTQEVWEQLCGRCSFVTWHFKESLVPAS